METKQLKQGLLNLSTSPVKADQAAIARLERETGQSTYEMVVHLDDIEQLVSASESTPEVREESKMEILGRAAARGAWTASVAGLAVLMSNPSNLPNGLALGAIAGISSEFLARGKQS